MIRLLAATALALALATPLSAQHAPDVTTEFDSVRHRTIVTMAKVPLDREHELGAFYEYNGREQQAAVPEFTLHFVHMGAQWAYIYAGDPVLLLDDRTRMPLTRVTRAMKAGNGYVLEQMFLFISLAQASQIAQAHKVAMAVGTNQFVWSDSLHGAFRHMTAVAERRERASDVQGAELGR